MRIEFANMLSEESVFEDFVECDDKMGFFVLENGVRDQSGIRYSFSFNGLYESVVGKHMQGSGYRRLFHSNRK